MPISERLAATLAERYRIERELGAGGMATVYLAEDLRHKRRVAMKVLAPELAATVGAERFLREITIAAGLQHPNILPVFDSGETDGVLWYTMPWVEGESLRARLSREGELPIDTALQFTREVADALDHAHRQGVVHRDIKPENILLSAGHALVADFGIARAAHEEASRLTATGLVVGTPAYMSPEQAVGEREIGPQSDVYSLACVAFEMLTGEVPYAGPTARVIMVKRLTDPVPSAHRLRAAVTPALDRELMRGLTAIPADRHANASEFARAITAAVSPAAAASARPRPIAAAIVVMAAVLAALFVFYRLRSSPQEDRLERASQLLARRTPDAAMEALSAFEAALVKNPRSVPALAGSAYTYALFADWGWTYPGLTVPELRARALERSERAIAVDSTSAEAWMSRAYILALNDPYRMSGAVEAFERSLGIDSMTSEGWYQFGQALMALGRDSAASAAYRRAFTLDPNRPLALLSLAAISLNAGRLAEARDLIDRGIAASRTTTSPYARVVRGQIALLQGDIRTARDEAELALVMDTNYTVPARSLLASVAWAEGNRAASARELQRVLELVGDGATTPTTARFVASAQVAMGRLDDAVATVEQTRPRGAWLWFYFQSPEFRPLAGMARFQRVMREADPRLGR